MSIEKNGPSRREVVTGITAFAGTTAFERNAEAAEKELPDGLRNFLDAPASLHEYAMDDLKGHQLGDPLNQMVGVDGKISSKEKIDFRHQAAVLWRRKFAYKDKAGKTTLDYCSPATLEAIEELLTSYDVDKSGKCDIRQHRDRIGKAIAEVRKAIDLDSITDIHQFSDFEDSDLRLLKALEGHISSTMLLAYSLTEIIPAKGGEIGSEALDFLLRNAGSDYVDRIPALYDTKLSFGPYQFTSSALFKVGPVRQGASIIDGLAQESQIPGSVLKLRGSDHHKAAYCFAVYNLAYAVDELRAGKSEKLLQPELLKHLDARLVLEYIASAHHMPTYARKSFISFTDQLIAAHDHPNKNVRVDPYIGHAAAVGLSDYVNKTTANVRALKDLYNWTL